MTENNVMARINGRDLTKEEVQNFINMMGNQGMQFQNEEGLKKVADELVNQELMFLDAKKQGLDKDEAYLKEVERSNENLLKQYAINKLLSTIELKDEDLEEYYESHKEHFQKPMQFTASHILVEDEEKAKEIKEKIEAGEVEFEEAAKEHSTCPSKDQGGKLGTFQEGQMVKEFEEAAKTAEVGVVTDPVKTQFGYHLIKVDDKTDADAASFEEVKDDIQRQVLSLKQQEVYLDNINKISSEYEVEKFY